MNHLEALVVQFNQEILKVEPRPLGHISLDEFKLSKIQLLEEIEEIHTARDCSDLIGVIDGAIDLVYFAYGFLYKHGLSPEQINACFSAVHDANMSKKKGIKPTRIVTDSDNHPADAVKPDGWVAPEDRIATILDL